MKNLNLKYVLLLSVMMLAGACSDSKNDEPQQTETGVFKNLKKCPVDGAYTGEILELSYPDNDGYDGVWCYVTEAPKDAVSQKAPCAESYIFFKRSDFEGIDLPVGKIIAFHILEYEIDTYRFHNWLLFKNNYYYNCIIKPL